MSPLVTVLTPTFDRARTLPRLYRSLLDQRFDDFEWVVVDDGSNDDTEELIHTWQREAEIPVRYVHQPNSGKHVAVNRGVLLARGELTTITDSDDWYTPDGLGELVERWFEIPSQDRRRFAGVVGLCEYEDGRIVGDRFPSDPLDCDAAELTYVYGVRGDKHSLLRTDVLRDFPFPFPDMPGLVTESLVWNRIALHYSERHVNAVVKRVEYHPGGMSDRALELQIVGARATRQFFLEESRLPHALSRRRRMRSMANFIRFSLHAGVGLRAQAREASARFTWLALVPLGLALFWRDRMRHRGVTGR